ncbi:hypothetical protein KORDIASMS9_02269 [Kordia sp. SMS9]|nr:hypothetical protein KORDIASMS9_02269 [Kordia sp. SMS9]
MLQNTSKKGNNYMDFSDIAFKYIYVFQTNKFFGSRKINMIITSYYLTL